MSRPRKELHSKLEEVLGSNYVYFQPTSNTKLTYPCIVYNILDKPIWKANNSKYVINNEYSVTFITKDPDSTIPDSLLESFFYCSLTRQYVVDNLYHTVFSIYF